ncbi:hypothetical protein IKF02_04425, partial [Candidatus Saccharibacteria bacterium]|nr:hypothetical protein [Candidatus Saccharibacteria bacterium]
MQIVRGKLLFSMAFFSAILAGFMNCQVFAEDDIGISMSSYSVEMNLLPGQFDEESQSITASTTSVAGYTVNMRTVGASSALINITDSDYAIQTFDLLSG